MRLEHINLVVSDLNQSIEFYQAAFPDWKIRGQGDDEWYGKPRRWVHFGDEHSYIALNNNGDSAPRNLAGHQQGLAHFGFEVQDLDSLIQRLSEVGYEVHHFGASHPHRKNVYFHDPSGVEVEFVQYLSDLNEQRNQYS